MNAPYTIGTKNSVKIALLAEAQNWRCAYCGCRCDGEPNTRFAPSREHVIPVVAGGLHEWGNEVMACNLCNNGRGAMYARRYFEKVQKVGRWKAFKWAVNSRRKYRKKRSESPGQSPLAARGSELGFQQSAGEGCA
jgi:hypothetical protein